MARDEGGDAVEQYRALMEETFGYAGFRSGQADALRALSQGDTLAVMPTGSGKSLCYVLPALVHGRTLVVSPLIALMQDQVESLRAAGVNAAFINSNLTRQQRNDAYLGFIRGQIPLLYVAPEGLANTRFVEGLRKNGVSLLAIDEAHCISEWGHDFRPEYLELGEVRRRLDFPRTLALTATADPRVRRDIASRLGLPNDVRQVVTSVNRPNLRFSVEEIASAQRRQSRLVEYVNSRPGESGIVYARTRRTTERLAEALREAGARAEAYHAGLDREKRAAVQRRFTMGETDVVAATTAFGMGIDKPDVRFVVHFNMPGRLEAYYQQAGRAGRDGEPADCLLLYAASDRQAQQGFIDDAHPSAEQVRSIWTRWALTGQPPSEDEEDGVANAVEALRKSGLVAPLGTQRLSNDPEAPLDTRAIDEHRRHAEERLARMVEYAESRACRRAIILRYFGEDAPDNCRSCDVCENVDEEQAGEIPEELLQEVLRIRDGVAERSGRDPDDVFEMRTAREIAVYRPRSDDELLQVWGIGPVKARWFGARLLDAVKAWEKKAGETRRPSKPARRSRVSPAAGTQQDHRLQKVSNDHPLFQRIKRWRKQRADEEGVPAFTLFSDRTIRNLVLERPRDMAQLRRVWGLGSARVERFGPELIRVIKSD